MRPKKCSVLPEGTTEVATRSGAPGAPSPLLHGSIPIKDARFYPRQTKGRSDRPVDMLAKT